jgi:hypothetical protein
MMTRLEEIRRKADSAAFKRCKIVLEQELPEVELENRRKELIKRLNDSSIGPGYASYEHYWSELVLIHQLLTPWL